jgi:hypothetical protein
MVGARRIAGAAVVVLLLAGGVAVVRADGRDAPGDEGGRRASAVAWQAPSPSPTTVDAPAEDAPEIDDAGTVSARSAGLQRFDDCRQLADHVRAAAVEQVTPYGLAQHGHVQLGFATGGSAGGAAAGSGDAAPAPASSGAAAGGGGAAGEQAFSGTNVQEAGVDEPDVVKNDGRRAFTLFGGRLRAMVLGDDGPRLAGEIDLGLPEDAELLEVGDRVVALASTGPFATSVVLVDVADPDAPTVLHRVEVEGAYLSARSIGDSVRIVVTQNGPAFDFTFPREPGEADAPRALEHNRRAVARAQLAEWLPDVTVDGGRALVPAPPCGSTYVTTSFAGPGSTTVVTLSPDDGSVLDATAVLATASEVYASADHLYVATTAWGTAPTLTTEIHRFDVSDPRRSVYEASGSVPGHLLQPPWFVGSTTLGQWAMSEHEGDLRVATTVLDGPGMSNTVTVLRRADDRLQPIGVLPGLGVDEQLYAVRFMGARGYVVTYRKVDPLYVLDLADPRAPSVVGELKVPGYSAYLHPVGDGLLLGIGQSDDDEDGLADGSQVSLFDVSDPARPMRTAHVKLGERGSLAGVESDHRTFTWWPEPARAVLTMTNWEDPSRFHGAVVLDPVAGLREIGRLEHRVGDQACPVPIVRSRVVGDALLTFSAAGLDVHAVGDLEPRASLRYDGAGVASSSCRGAPPARQAPGPGPAPLPAAPAAGD